MQVKMGLDDVSIELGTKGLLLKVSKPKKGVKGTGAHVGDLRIGKATVEWMKGRTREGNGKKISLEKLLEMIGNG